MVSRRTRAPAGVFRKVHLTALLRGMPPFRFALTSGRLPNRSPVIVFCAESPAAAVIAGRLGVHVSVVSRWRRRLAEEGLAGLADRKEHRSTAGIAAVVAGRATLANDFAGT
jgi:alkanesulfonate monooxygenase SsuD/methylene tetrahydromethanopterin reductase-like flavin-dependent oxidoreductase (luciferase family)